MTKKCPPCSNPKISAYCKKKQGCKGKKKGKSSPKRKVGKGEKVMPMDKETWGRNYVKSKAKDKSRGEGKSKSAKHCGVRRSKSGKLYKEVRPNRCDETTKGL